MACVFSLLLSLPPVKLLLSVHYPDAYPDVLPELKLSTVEGDVTDSEIDALVNDLLTIVSITITSAHAQTHPPRAKKIWGWP